VQDHKPTWATGYDGDNIYGGFFPGFGFTEVWEECLNRIQELPNLTDIAIVYDRHGASDTQGDDSNDQILQTRDSRHDLLKKLFHSMDHRIKHLSLRHFQDIIKAPPLGGFCCVSHRPQKDIEESELAFATDNSLRESVIGGLESLQMSMVHEQPRGESGNTLDVSYLPTLWVTS
jgi:hypothetical protein